MDNLEANIMDKSMRSVFVGNIPYEATEEKLKDIFGEVGQVLSFKLVFDRETGKPKGYGFCEYRDQETALSAMRNLNGYEIGGRNLRVDNACTEKSRMEMQNLLNQPLPENPYGEPVQAEKAPEAISKAVASLPPEQMFELMKQMKTTIQNNPTEARQMLLQNPQLAYALLQAQVVMKIIDPHTAASLLHPREPVPATLMPGDKNVPVQVPISRDFQAPPPAPVAPPRQEFQPVPAPIMPPVTNHKRPVFTGQDIDLRALDPRGGPEPRMGSRMGDQDMRQLPPAPLANPLPPVNEPLMVTPEVLPSFPRDPRESRNPSGASFAPIDPRQAARADPRQKAQRPITPPQTIRAPPQSAASVAAAQTASAVTNGAMPPGASDQEKAALIMQVLQLSDEQIAMLPPEQRNSILVLKEQIAKSAQGR
ncbi:LOW QUALITY PROTEIN: cleavage stimulation factor subunit 2 tau variant [Anthonomus grandis grandis]|uniref:LOW QUALITY PROTEIN: cleavage stimulation factor subunit 2 tau variant n=1 Tax=Anthonomus grandis grandis TaxID=2921223 RepID=UPI002165B158|nr:LOW QUALITY PROTEIN: cleavage stimulation factor subunit 2 tau variant [Anthonomus grandis grandis]